VRAGFEDLQGGGGLVHAASFPASEHAVFETGFQLSRAATDWFMSPVFLQCRLTHWDRILQKRLTEMDDPRAVILLRGCRHRRGLQRRVRHQQPPMTSECGSPSIGARTAPPAR
jgi:hypothetical protein